MVCKIDCKGLMIINTLQRLRIEINQAVIPSVRPGVKMTIEERNNIKAELEAINLHITKLTTLLTV